MAMPERVIGAMKLIFDVLLILTLYVGEAVGLQSDFANILPNVGASIAGSVVLAYFRRDRDHKEIFFKAGCASICGMVTGSLVVQYYGVTQTAYERAIYFFSSLLVLFLIKGLLAFTENNASGLVVTLVQSFLPKAATTAAGRAGLSISPHETDPAGVITSPATGGVVKTEIRVEKDTTKESNK